MVRKKILTSKEKIIVALSPSVKRVDGLHSNTQKGISESTGILLNHVPRELSAMEKEGLVESCREHVIERGRTLKVYSLTQRGRVLAGKLCSRLSESTRGSNTIMELVEMHGVGVVDILEEGKIPAHVYKPRETSIRLVGRRDEVRAVSNFLSSKDDRILIIYGGKGIGRKTLVKHCLENVGHKRVLWIDVSLGRKDAFTTSLEGGLRKRGLVWGGDISLLGDTLLVLADYHDPEEGLVDMLSEIAASIHLVRGLRIIVTAREDTPIYSRFYTSAENPVREMTLKGLSMEESAAFMGIGVSEEMKTMHQLLRGKPLALKCLMDDNRDGLLGATTLNPEEVRLLLYLKEKAVGIDHGGGPML